MRPVLAALLALPLLLAGCTRTLLVTVDGYAAPASGKAGPYRLVSGNPRVPETDLQYRSLASQVAAALAEAGRTPAPDPKDAATLIRFRWSVSEPLSEIREYDTPEFGVTGYHVAETKRTDAAGNTVTRASMTPAYGHTGYTRRTDARVTYGMSVVLEAYDISRPDAEGEPPQLWKTIVSARDTRGDIRAALPAMLKAAAPLLATDTRGLREIEIPYPENK